MRARHPRWRKRYFPQREQYWLIHKFSLFFKDMMHIERPKTTKRPCLYWKAQSKICYASNVHLKMSKNLGKEEEHSRDREQE